MSKISFEKIYKLAQKPELFAKSTASLWDDEHISKGMLEAHLNPDIDAASRKLDFIEASVKWMIKYSKIGRGAKILDLGCGPGLYAERLSKAGYEVTGIDFSRRSIEYAKKQALKDGLDIRYLYQDYLTIDFSTEFDLAILIYCDLGVLPDKDRDTVLKKVYGSLRPGGLFIFDVFTPMNNKDVKEYRNTWEIQDTGYWRSSPHICMHSHYTYPEHDTNLEQVIVFDASENVDVYHLWNHFYTKEKIDIVLKSVGFVKTKYFSDVAGKEYNEKAKTLCVVAEKQMN